ncbi:hypothetical protein [Phenylobacterium sp.]|uniref:hypothetical protein n=1 Tax=Phenylobacterium sp. TaxID=1871053 RepID=UPI00272FB79C|nr:hypothetical protein [Phenylobacterium sp.]
MPPVLKAVVYLDQFAISNIFKLRNGTLSPTSNSYDFWSHLGPVLSRAYLRQQVAFPSSPIHFKETNVSATPAEMRAAHAMLSGEVSFRRLEEIELGQLIPFARAFHQGQAAPSLDLQVRDILVGDPDRWLPRYHIGMTTDYSAFAPGQRKSRDAAASELAALTRRWAVEKPSFEAVFTRELEAFGSAKLEALSQTLQRAARAQEVHDLLELFEATHTPDYVQFLQLAGFFESLGVPADEGWDTVVRFWSWSGMADLPFHRLGAALFASLARKFTAGQKKAPSPGMLSDFEAISLFGPYVDAMLLDRECSNFVRELRPDPAHLLRAKVFSLADGDEFIDYLNILAEGAPEDVRQQADALYRPA